MNATTDNIHIDGRIVYRIARNDGRRLVLATCTGHFAAALYRRRVIATNFGHRAPVGLDHLIA